MIELENKINKAIDRVEDDIRHTFRVDKSGMNVIKEMFVELSVAAELLSLFMDDGASPDHHQRANKFIDDHTTRSPAEEVAFLYREGCVASEIETRIPHLSKESLINTVIRLMAEKDKPDV
jgi:hypothetical protein